jgi:integrase/recombinase XerD
MNDLMLFKSDSKPVEYIEAPDKDRIKKGVDIWLKNCVTGTKLIPTTRQQLIHDRDILMIEWLWNTGMRISDALSIKFMDVDMAKEMVTFIVKKRSRPGKPFALSISLDKGMLFEVQRYKDRCRGKPEDRLFPMSRMNAWDNLDKYAELAGFKEIIKTTKKGTVTKSHFHPHILRHSMCMNDLMNGIAPEVTQYRAGHASLDTTINTYRKMNVAIERIIRSKL